MSSQSFRQELYEIPGELEIEWKIKIQSVEFLNLYSPVQSEPFYFAGTSWRMELFCDLSPKSIFFTLTSLSPASGVKCVEFATGLKTAEGSTFSINIGSCDYDEIQNFHDILRVPYQTLMDKKCELLPSNVLTVTLTLKNNQRRNISNSLFKRLTVLADDMEKFYSQRTDVTLDVKGQKLPTNRVILEARSKTFAQKLKDKQTEELKIDDMDPASARIVLDFLHKGDVYLRKSNVLRAYTAAKMYEMEELKQMCLDYIENNLTEKWMFDVMEFADKEKEEEMDCFVTKYFVENAAKIIDTRGWEMFSKAHPDKSIKLLTCSVRNKTAVRTS